MTQYRIEWKLLKYSRISSHGDWHGHASKKMLEQNENAKVWGSRMLYSGPNAIR